MRYLRSERFLADYKALAPHERRLFREAVRRLNDAYAAAPAWPPRWPGSLRIKPIAGAHGIWELTWSFAGPAGRATFELTTVGGEPAVKWRRIGGHDIFPKP